MHSLDGDVVDDVDAEVDVDRVLLVDVDVVLVVHVLHLPGHVLRAACATLGDIAVLV